MYKNNRIKATLYDLIQNDVFYYAFNRVKDKNGATGWRYILDRPLTEAQKNTLAKYKNIVFCNCWYKYNPQLKYDAIILFDKCIKAAQNG